MKFDLEERTLDFSKEIIRSIKSIKLSVANRNIIEQLLRSATSVGANYCEALGGASRKDFRNKIFIYKKEAQETRYWLKLLFEIESGPNDKLNDLLDEANQLVLIFNKIGKSST